jgi:hypothetical protein
MWRRVDLVFDWWLRLQRPADTGSSFVDFSTLMIETIRSSETSVHTRSTRRHIPEDGNLQINSSPDMAFSREWTYFAFTILSMIRRWEETRWDGQID